MIFFTFPLICLNFHFNTANYSSSSSTDVENTNSSSTESTASSFFSVCFFVQLPAGGLSFLFRISCRDSGESGDIAAKWAFVGLWYS